MAKQVINNLESAALVRSKLNDNFTELYPAIGQTAPASETSATFIAQTALKLKAKVLGTLGNGANNGITVKATTSADDVLRIVVTPQVIGVSPFVIDIQLANTTGANNTATLVYLALIGNVDSNAIVSPIPITGTTQITPFTVQNLTGGINGDVGYICQQIKDTNSTIWTCIHSISDTYYYWSPNDIPATNTKYPAYYSDILNAVVWKQRFTGTTNSIATVLAVDTNIHATDVIVEKCSGRLVKDANASYPLPVGYSDNALVCAMNALIARNQIYLRSYVFNNASYTTKPYYYDLFFITG